MKAVSFYDGHSCGRLALQRSGFDVESYDAYEIEPSAIMVSKWNFPDIQHHGSVVGADFTKHAGADILMGGSPCQGFSFAGKQLNFDDPRSALFFEFVRGLEEINPKYFLLENVPMKQEYQDVISNYLGVAPIMINSGLLSAQSRKRLYWTNIEGIDQPEDLGLSIRDILETARGGLLRPYTLRDTLAKGGACMQVGMADDIKGLDANRRIYDIRGKAPTLTSCGGGHREPKIAVSDTHYRKLTPVEAERLQTLPDGYTEVASKSKRYGLCGLGWTVDVVAYILNHIHLKDLL